MHNGPSSTKHIDTMTLTELRYLVALARERHFGHAAQACNVSQPTLSAAIKKLEEQLGMPLFERRPREVVVTPQAEPIVTQAQRVLEQADLLSQMALSQRDQLGSPLRVGAIFTVAPYLFPAMVPRVRKAAPDMPLFIEENYTHVLRRKLEHGELDAIIVALPFSGGGLCGRVLRPRPRDGHRGRRGRVHLAVHERADCWFGGRRPLLGVRGDDGARDLLS